MTTAPAVKVEPIRVLLADDHPLVREGLRTILEAESDLQLVGEACTGTQALEQVERLQPRVTLLDLSLPEMSGLEVARQLQKNGSSTAIVILTIYDSESYLAEAMAAGAAGYVLKDQPPQIIPLAIRLAAAGGNVFPRQILSRILDGWTASQNNSPVPMAPREISILRLIAKGYSNRAISEELNLAESTIKKYVYNLMGKLGASDRGHAAVLAMRLGMVE